MHRNRIFCEIRQHWRHGIIGGAMQLLAYGIVIWAMKSTPIALVAALRETSVLFAMVISIWMLKEKPSILRYGHPHFCSTDFDVWWACLNLSGVRWELVPAPR
ncbi:hypothetical protein [Yersinia enterocolitica]|uniref:EamA family transporter n=1 Tax=Yersinia enterocolitica TaxID=630 RepID=UPI001EFDB8BD|nr:hypothetical protein [Yersinia enterocolitica]